MQKRSIFMMLIVFLCSATFVFAADQKRDRTRDQKKDGSCKLTEKAFEPLLTADQTRTRSQQQKRIKKSTGADLTDTVDGNLLSADRDRTRDQKKDGSCKSTGEAFRRVLAADQSRDRKQDRKRDGSCRG